MTTAEPDRAVVTADSDLIHYLGILEAVVAVLAIKAGLNPETMMGKAIEEITEQAGMETLNTERIIRERWTGRNTTAGRLVAHYLPDVLEPKPVVVPEDQPVPDPAPSMVERFRDYRERLNQAAAMGLVDQSTNHGVPEQS